LERYCSWKDIIGGKKAVIIIIYCRGIVGEK
jgi:hypothetical protein